MLDEKELLLSTPSIFSIFLWWVKLSGREPVQLAEKEMMGRYREKVPESNIRQERALPLNDRDKLESSSESRIGQGRQAIISKPNA